MQELGDPPAAITIERVCKRYGRGPQAVLAVADVSLRVRAGEFVSIMGPSGCGKSTLLNLIAGIDSPDSGQVMVSGHDLARLSDDARSDLRLQSIGFVFQSFNLFPTFTVEENVAWPLEFLGERLRQARARATQALDQVGFDRRASQRRPLELSGGEQQRVAVARALVTDPMVVLADEPTGNLDSRSGQAILDLLRGLNSARALTVVMVTHSAFAAAYGDRIVELCDGRIIRETNPPRDGSGRVVPLRESS